jgi:hypothetical protein
VAAECHHGRVRLLSMFLAELRLASSRTEAERDASVTAMVVAWRVPRREVPAMLWLCAEHAQQAGRTAKALALYRRAAEGGDAVATVAVALHQAEQGEFAEADRLYRQ